MQSTEHSLRIIGSNAMAAPIRSTLEPVVVLEALRHRKHFVLNGKRGTVPRYS